MPPKKRVAENASVVNNTKRPRNGTDPVTDSTTDPDDQVLVTPFTGQPLATATSDAPTNLPGRQDTAIPQEPNIAPTSGLIWATNRQSLCDALPSFKAHQSGTYTNKLKPQGILLGGNEEIGDTLTANKCIYTL